MLWFTKTCYLIHLLVKYGGLLFKFVNVFQTAKMFIDISESVTAHMSVLCKGEIRVQFW